MYYIIPQLFEILKWTDLSELFLIPITAFTKISISIYVTRIPHSQRLKRSMHALMAFLAVTNGVCFIAFLLQCRPMRAMWDLTIQDACWSQNIFVAFGYFQGGSSPTHERCWALLIADASHLRSDGFDLLYSPDCRTLEGPNVNWNQVCGVRSDSYWAFVSLTHPFVLFPVI